MGTLILGLFTSLHYNCESRLYLQWSCKVSLLPLIAARLSHKFNVHSVLLRPGGHFIIITINILIIMAIIIFILIITTLHWFFLIPQKLVEPGNPGCVQYVLVGEGGQLTPLGPLLQVCVCVCVILLSSPSICHLLLCVWVVILFLSQVLYHINTGWRFRLRWGVISIGWVRWCEYQKCNDYDEIVHADKGSRHERKVQFFLTLFKRPLPPPPLRLNIMWWIFFEGILTKVRRRLSQQLSTK